MIKKSCRLQRASRYYMGGGGGGGTDVMMRNPAGEKKTVGNWYDFNIGRAGDYRDNDRLLGPATTGALDFWNQLPGMLAKFPGFEKEISGYQGQLQDVFGGSGGLLGQIPGLQNQFQQGFGGLMSQLPGLSNQLTSLGSPFQKFLSPNSALNDAYKDNASTLRNEGALSHEGLRSATQLSRSMGPSGTSNDPGAIARDVLSREDFRQQNLNRALGVSQNILGQQSGATGVLSGLLGQKAGLLGLGGQLLGQNAGIQQGLLGLGGSLLGQQGGIAGMGAGLTGQKAGLLGQQQALQTGGLNQLLGVGNAATSQFGSLTNPMLSYLSNLFSGNQQASVAQAQINAGQNAAGDAKTGGAIQGGASIVGALIPVVAAAV